MRILNRYIGKDFLITFGITLAVFTFVMSVAAVFRAVDYVAKGASAAAFAKIFLYNLPFLLTFTIPMSTMTATLLVFGKLSMDGEITAMRACGVSLWQAITPVVLISIVLSALCAWLSSSLAPNLYHARRQVITELGGEDPTTLLETGRPVRDFPGYTIIIGKKDGHEFEDIIVYEHGGRGLKSELRARTGDVEIDGEAQEVIINLYEVRIRRPDKEDPGNIAKESYVQAEQYPLRIDLAELMKKSRKDKKLSDRTLAEIIQGIRDVRSLYEDIDPALVGKERMSLLVEANKRLALSMSCFAFAVLGIPLGMTSKRRESAVGIGISLLVVFFFYFFIIVAETLVDKPALRSDLIVWVPIVACEVAGFLMLRRIA